MNKTTTVKVFDPDLSAITNMSVTKNDILAIFEEDLREELEKKLNETSERIKALKELIKNSEKKISEILVEEGKKHFDALKKAFGFAKESIRFDVEANVVDYSSRCCEEKDDDKIRLKTSILVILFNPQNANDGSETHRYEMKITPEIKAKCSPAITEMRTIRKTLAEIEKLHQKYYSELHNLSGKVKKFSVQMTKEALNSMPTGKNVLETIQRLTDKLKSKMDLKQLR